MLFRKHQSVKVNIKYGKLLDPIFTFYCQNNPELKALGWNDWTPPTEEDLSGRIKAYQAAWMKSGDQILSAIEKSLDLSFERNIIDVFIVGGNPRQISSPLIIKSGYEPDELVDILSHELIHVILSENFKKIPSNFVDLITSEGNLSNTTKNHVVVFAFLKHLFLDVLKDEAKLNRAIKNSEKHSTEDYVKAWEIVNEIGYIEILKKFRELVSK